MSALHALKLGLAAKLGLPPKWWRKGVTVLLEHICGNNFVHKCLQAIYLFEAYLNWWNKFVFAKGMMKNAADEELVPHVIFSKKGSHAANTIM